MIKINQCRLPRQPAILEYFVPPYTPDSDNKGILLSIINECDQILFAPAVRYCFLVQSQAVLENPQCKPQLHNAAMLNRVTLFSSWTYVLVIAATQRCCHHWAPLFSFKNKFEIIWFPSGSILLGERQLHWWSARSNDWSDWIWTSDPSDECRMNHLNRPVEYLTHPYSGRISKHGWSRFRS